MTDLQQGILTLVKSAIMDQPFPLPSGFALEDAIDLSREHELTPLICEGAVNCGIHNTPVFRSLLQESCQHLLASERQAGLVRSIFRTFNENGIDYMPVKGCLMKQRYPKHEFRPMGDADILVRTEQYDQIRPLMLQLGFKEDAESNHEYIWNSVSLHVELHKRLVPSYNKDYYSYFGDGWRLASSKQGTRYAMKPEDELIYLFVHMAKHYRDGGIGCRQLVDLWVHRRCFPEMDEEYLRRELKKLQLLEFYDNILRTLKVWFEDGKADEITELITSFIFASGAWGHEEIHLLSEAVKNRKLAGSAWGGKLRFLIINAFPPYLNMAMDFPVLKKAPWLLPLMWPVRWLDLLFFRRQRMLEKRELMRNATDDKVQAYQQQLNAVGLDFRFREKESSSAAPKQGA
jgi:hypothetical protein